MSERGRYQIGLITDNGEPPTKKFKDDISKNKRSKFACIRCRKRKSKCSGEIPCLSCVHAGCECNYAKKPKKVYIMDTEIEDYQIKIQMLTEELNHLKSIQNRNGDNANDMMQKQPLIPKDKLNLSIWLGSPACELICWNLDHISRTDFKTVSNLEETLISPDFDTLIEEQTYDYIIRNIQRETARGKCGTLREFCSTITLDLVEQMIDNVVFFINSGYLIINPIEFRAKVKLYFKENGMFDTNKIQEDTRDYFLFNILMIMTLGKVYSRECSIGRYIPVKPMKSPPGLNYFSMVVQYLPSSFQLLSLSSSMTENIEIIELLSLISFYLRMLDKKSASLIFTLNALQLCMSLNFHKKSKFQSNGENDFDVNRVWWSTYCLNRFFSVRVGQQLLLNPKEITANYPQSSFYKSTSSKLSKYDYGDGNSMIFYINLAKLSDRITRELYCIKTPFGNRDYLNVILKILEALVDWVQNIPQHLKLNVSNNYNSETDRLIYSLHLNYLHHIYLTCVPILLNLTKMKISTHKRNPSWNTEPLKLDALPRNITYVITSCLNACRLTINICMTVYKEGYLSSFGFTDLDHLFSSSLVFIMGIILRIKIPNDLEYYTFNDYLDVAMSLMSEMNLKGNLISRGKLIQITNLLRSLCIVFTDLGFYELYSKYDSVSKDFQLNNTAEVIRGVNQSKTSIDSLLNDIDSTTPIVVNRLSSDKLSEEKRPIQNAPCSYGKLTQTLETGTNTLLEFNLGKDVNFISKVDDVHNFPLEDHSIKSRFDDSHPFTVTDEDMLFLDQIIQDFTTIAS